MNTFPVEFTRVLAVDIASRGLGFALLEDRLGLIDWGFHNTRGDRNARCLDNLNWMLTAFKPDVLVIEDLAESRRPEGVKHLADGCATAAQMHGISCRRVSRSAVRSAFPECRSKYDRARELASRFPELEPSCPPKRKAWMTEDSRINLFDALSLAVAHLAQAKKKPKSKSVGAVEDC
jgi:hypothetical protein